MWQRWLEWQERFPRRADAVLALVMSGLALAALAFDLHRLRREGVVLPHAWESYGLTLTGTLPIAIRRDHAWLSLLAVNLSDGYQIGIGLPSYVLDASSMITLYTIAASRRLVSGMIAGAIWLVSSYAGLARLGALRAGHAVGAAVAGVLIVYVGQQVKYRIKYAELREEQAAVAEAAAISGERRRIARELHDIVAHHISVMGLLARGAERQFDTHPAGPATARQALADIDRTGREALAEMRRLLGVLRGPGDAGSPAGESAPQPGLSDLPALLDSNQRAGLPVRYVVRGTPVPLPAGLGPTVYRIVQEALTNVRRHAGATLATVTLTYDSGELVLEVADDGSAASRPPPRRPRRDGHGMLGMRERASLFGGTLAAGPVPGGGFRVSARIPLPEEVR